MRKILLFPFLLLMGLILNSCNNITGPDAQLVQIYFKYSFSNVLNTFDNTYQKDLVMDGTITVNFWLTAEEQKRILDKANEIDFFLLPEDFPKIDSLDFDPNPGLQKMQIKYQNKNKTVTWHYPLDSQDPQVAALMSLKDFIIQIIEAKPEYKKLPMGRGGYQ